MCGGRPVSDYRIKFGWRTHGKRRKIKRRLGFEGLVAVVDLWAYVAENKPSGNLSGMSNEDLADAAGFEGDPDKFASALLEAGLVDGIDGGYVMHDWADHQGWVIGAESRSASSKSAINIRWHNAGNHKGAPHPECPICHAESYDPNTDRIRNEYGSIRSVIPPSLPSLSSPLPPSPDGVRDTDDKPRQNIAPVALGNEPAFPASWMGDLWQYHLERGGVGGVQPPRKGQELLRDLFRRGYTLDQAKEAVDGMRDDDWWGKRSDMWTLGRLCKDEDTFNEFRAKAKPKKAATGKTKSQAGIDHLGVVYGLGCPIGDEYAALELHETAAVESALARLNDDGNPPQDWAAVIAAMETA